MVIHKVASTVLLIAHIKELLTDVQVRYYQDYLALNFCRVPTWTKELNSRGEVSAKALEIKAKLTEYHIKKPW